MPRFKLIRLSLLSHGLLYEYANDAFAVGCSRSSDDIHEAMSRLSVSRKAISEYIEHLEKRAGIEQPIQVRYD